MRFLPVFLDLQAGSVLLVGGGELARAKLRLLAAAGAHIRWFSTDGHHDVAVCRPPTWRASSLREAIRLPRICAV